jgi:D-beta-D-heptose 7-phosphate kinase/D-beta-D-heptose 1-phosphate adenosyltransferase
MVNTIIVVGDAIIDEYQHLDTDRTSPEAPVLVVTPKAIEHRVGGCLNVALNLSRLGNKVIVVSQLGDDDCAEVWEKVSAQEGIRTINIASVGYQTINKKRLVCRNQQLLRIDTEAFVEPQLNPATISECTKVFASADMIVISDYAKGTVTAEVMKLVKENSKFIVDPKLSDWSRYSGAEVITPNRKELSAVLPKSGGFGDKEICELIRDFSIKSILLTMSEMGVKFFDGPHAPIHLETVAQNIVDVTGAGDVVISVLAHLLAQGMTKVEAITIANIMAGKSVSTFGTHVVSIKELNDVISPKEINVFTNGCFDILHAGHVDYLKKAKNLGNRLIVGLNSDASIARIKGPIRPINLEGHRKSILEALDCVDQVIIFDEDTPLQLIEQIQPDILVKGGDYTTDQIVGADFIRKIGGKVITIDVVHDVSTSKIISTLIND